MNLDLKRWIICMDVGTIKINNICPLLACPNNIPASSCRPNSVCVTPGESASSHSSQFESFVNSHMSLFESRLLIASWHHDFGLAGGKTLLPLLLPLRCRSWLCRRTFPVLGSSAWLTGNANSTADKCSSQHRLPLQSSHSSTLVTDG